MVGRRLLISSVTPLSASIASDLKFMPSRFPDISSFALLYPVFSFFAVEYFAHVLLSLLFFRSCLVMCFWQPKRRFGVDLFSYEIENC